MKSRTSDPQKLADDLAEVTRRLKAAQAEARRADQAQTAANDKLADIGRRLSGLKSQLAQLAEDRERERGSKK
jgi:predicted  nucleic acid-binding Zn-ribbon protein